MRFVVLLACLTLVGCGSQNDPGVGGVTKGEAGQLNEAAEALNQDKAPPSVADKAAPVPEQAVKPAQAPAK